MTERYFELLKESKVKGYLFEMQNYVPVESESAGGNGKGS